MSNAHKRRSETGFLSVEIMAATALSLIFLVMMTNFVVIQYGRGIVRAAADEGARAGSRVSNDSIALCNSRGNDVLGSLGKMANNVKFQCAVVNNQIEANASAKFPPWMPGVPTFNENDTAFSVKEQAPAPAKPAP